MPLNTSTLLSPLHPMPTPAGDFTFQVRDGDRAGLSEDEAAVAQYLARQIFDRRAELLLSNLYYEGMQPVTSLGIMIPPELEGLRAVLGWAETGVNARDQRLNVQGFRLPSSTSTVDDLWDIWQSNNLVEESGLAHLDAMVYGTSYVVIGPREGGGQPLITIESPLDMYASWNARKRRSTSALQTYIDTDPVSEHYGRQLAALYLEDATVHMVRGEKGWQVIDRDDHRLGFVPVVPMANRERTQHRVGGSEITFAWRNVIDRACRNVNGMEVSREFWGAPQRYIIAAAKDAFEGDAGARAAWEAYIGRILVLEADENGLEPKVGTFESGSPEPFTKLYDVDVRNMSSLTGLAPHYLGIYSDGNPSSADAIRLSDHRLKTIANEKCKTFGGRWEDVMRTALLIRDGKLPDDAHRMETDWAPTGIPTPAADTDAITKQIAAGMIPPESDVALEAVGYSAVDRERIKAERRRARGGKAVADIIQAFAPTPRLLPSDEEPQAA